MSPPKLELVGLRKAYADGAIPAVDGIDLEVATGETLALLGPSGCGKSTTLNMIVGLETPTAGDIRIDGVSVRGLPPGARKVGLVFQDYAVFTHMTVAQNLAFGLAIRRAGRLEIDRAVDEVAELLDLRPILREKASRLGGSQLQRVAIGRTLVTRPALLLLDEPLSNLEAEARLAMRRELRRLQAEIGLSIVYVTHDQVEALSLADRIAVMSHGRIRQCDASATVYDRPSHVFVAGFMGSPPMNLLRGQLLRDGQGGRFQHGSFDLDLPAGLIPPGVLAGSQIVLGVRPETLRLGQAGATALAGEVALVAPRGRETVVTIGLGQAVLQALVPSGFRPTEGERIGIDVDPSSLVLFSGETGQSLAGAAS